MVRRGGGGGGGGEGRGGGGEGGGGGAGEGQLVVDNDTPYAQIPVEYKNFVRRRMAYHPKCSYIFAKNLEINGTTGHLMYLVEEGEHKGLYGVSHYDVDGSLKHDWKDHTIDISEECLGDFYTDPEAVTLNRFPHEYEVASV